MSPATLAILPQFFVRNSIVDGRVAWIRRSMAQATTATVTRVSRNQSKVLSLEGMAFSGLAGVISDWRPIMEVPLAYLVVGCGVRRVEHP
jgi:hypothetical protein